VTSALIEPAVVTAGQYYDLFVGNGAEVALDIEYTRNGVPGTIVNWPWVPAVSTGDKNGKARIVVEPCTETGLHIYRKIKNTKNDVWLDLTTNNPNNVGNKVQVNPPAPPTVTTRAPIAGKPGDTNVPITINGTSLCAVSLPQPDILPTNSGLTFAAVPATPPNSPATSLTTTFSIAATAAPRKTLVKLVASGGATVFPFYIGSSVAPAVTGLMPGNGLPGTTVDVTVTGTDLLGATLSTTHQGLSFDSIDYNDAGTSLTARFVIAANAFLGNPIVTVSTPAGSTTTQRFSIGSFVPFSKEYIYLGERLLAVETGPTVLPPNSTNTIAPSPPNASGQLLNANTGQVSAAGSVGGNGATVASFSIKRNGVLRATIAANQGAFVDTALSPGSTYTYRIAAVDSAGLTSAESNPVVLTTPPETIPPSTPSNIFLFWGETEMVMTWDASTDAGGSGLVGYNAYYVGFGYTILLNTWGPITTTDFYYDFTGWDFSDFSGIGVTAIDGAGNESDLAVWP
jgi:hypothetical protein